jgi:3D (Asp-Asp-Asp) domain-containing protein
MRSTITIAFACLLLTIADASAAPKKPKPRPRAATAMRIAATAYCQHGTTQAGTKARTGIVAADPRVFPVGSVLRIVDGPSSGIYTVLDTGPAVKGRKIDIFIPDCARAEKFGEQKLLVRILRRGWDPKASAPSDGAERPE